MITTVLRAAAARVLKPRIFDPVPVWSLVEAARERYRFQIVPTPEEVAKPDIDRAMFHFGILPHGTRNIEIERLDIYAATDAMSVSIGAATKSSTEDVDAVLDDVFMLLSGKFGIDVTTQSPTQYHSQLEFCLDGEFGRAFERFDPVVSRLREKLEEYGFGKHEFEVAGLQLNFDRASQKSQIMTGFVVERRNEIPFGENRFYSHAPLRTQDHMALLNLFVGLLAG